MLINANIQFLAMLMFFIIVEKHFLLFHTDYYYCDRELDYLFKDSIGVEVKVRID